MEPLSDPEGDRAMKDIIPPPHRHITTELLYPDKSIYFQTLLNFLFRLD